MARQSKDSIQRTMKNNRVGTGVICTPESDIEFGQLGFGPFARSPKVFIRLLETGSVEEWVQTVHPVPVAFEQMVSQGPWWKREVGELEVRGVGLQVLPQACFAADGVVLAALQGLHVRAHGHGVFC